MGTHDTQEEPADTPLTTSTTQEQDYGRPINAWNFGLDGGQREEARAFP